MDYAPSATRSTILKTDETDSFITSIETFEKERFKGLGRGTEKVLEVFLWGLEAGYKCKYMWRISGKDWGA